MTVYSLQAIRTLALRTQGLHATNGAESKPTRDAIYKTVNQIGCVQIDTIRVIRRSHYLVPWSRLGNYAPADLDALSSPADRCLFEGWQHAACYIPLTEYRYQIPHQRRLGNQPGNWYERWLKETHHSQMLQPGACGEWTVKDVLAHISAWERCMIRWIGSHLRGELPEVPLPWDVERMNTETYAQVKGKPLAEVLEESRQSYRDALSLAESLSEEQLQTVYTETWPMAPLWLGVAANMNWHYKEHRESIEAWGKNMDII